MRKLEGYSNNINQRCYFAIRHEGTNGTKKISSYGNDIAECLENMLEELDYFKEEYENNNYANGGNCAFTKDEDKLYQEIEDIKQEIESYL